jgi:hypothetical protein
MEKYLPSVNNRLDELIQITITERKQKGLGVLFLDFSEKDKLDCRYAGLSEEHFPQIVRDTYSDRMFSAPNSVIFFLIYDGTNELLYEVDLDKESDYHERENQTLEQVSE